MLWKRPALDVYLLKSNLRLLPAFDRIWFGLTPVSLLNQISSKRIHFAVDGAHPTGAVHHQKIVVIDDAVAFCGGVDLTATDGIPGRISMTIRRRRTLGRSYGPRHDVAAAVDGAAARALGEQASLDGRPRREYRSRRLRLRTSRGPPNWTRSCAVSTSESRSPCRTDE